MVTLGATRRIVVEIEGGSFTVRARGVSARDALAYQAAMADAADDMDSALRSAEDLLGFYVDGWEDVQDADGAPVAWSVDALNRLGIAAVFAAASEVLAGGSKRLGNG